LKFNLRRYNWVYVTAEDVEEIPNLQQKLEKIHIRTPDVTPPKFVGRQGLTLVHVRAQLEQLQDTFKT